MAGVTSLQRRPVGGLKRHAVPGIDSCLEGSQLRILDRLQNPVQVEVARLGSSDRFEPDGLFEMRFGLTEIELRERPVRRFTGKPEIGEVIRHIFHGVRLIRQ